MQQEADSKTVPYRQQPANKSKPPKPHIGPSNVIENRQGLTTVQLNFDRTGKQALPRLLAFADTHKVDALLLQDTTNCNWSYLFMKLRFGATIDLAPFPVFESVPCGGQEKSPIIK